MTSMKSRRSSRSSDAARFRCYVVQFRARARRFFRNRRGDSSKLYFPYHGCPVLSLDSVIPNRGAEVVLPG